MTCARMCGKYCQQSNKKEYGQCKKRAGQMKEKKGQMCVQKGDKISPHITLRLSKSDSIICKPTTEAYYDWCS